MSRDSTYPFIAIALRCMAVLALLGAWLLPALRPGQQLPQLIGLIDLSDSMPPGRAWQRWQEVREQARSYPGAAPSAVVFAGEARALGAATPDTAPAAGLEPRRSDIGAAIRAALPDAVEAGNAALLLISDGQDSGGTMAQALVQARESGVPVYVAPTAGPVEPHIGALSLPAGVQRNQAFSLRAEVVAAGARNLTLRAALDGETLASGALPATDRPSLLLSNLRARRSGAQLLDLELVDTLSGQLLDTRAPAALIDVAGSPAVLVLAQGETPLANSLSAGGWDVDRHSPLGFSISRERLERYQALVLDDVHASAPRAQFWSDVDWAVRRRGLGLLVLAGPRSFAAGGYRGTLLEGLLPVKIEPPGRNNDAALLFAIDTSGSMDSRSRGVDRLAYARAATLATVRAQPATDRIAVMFFDVMPRLALGWTGAGKAAAALEKAWNARASGGTQMGETLRQASAMLAQAGQPRRILVLVTDGFAKDESLAPQLAAMQRAGIEVIALAIGQDARVEALRKLVEPVGGTVLRVAEVAELPQFMRAGVDARRAAIVRGATTPLVVLAPPFQFVSTAWPAVQAYALTRRRDDAQTWLRTASGDPLMAGRFVEYGRVAVLTAGAGAWAPAWPRWALFGKFSGGLVTWASGAGGEANISITIDSTMPDILADIDISNASGWRDTTAPAVTLQNASGDELPVVTEQFGPGRYRARSASTATGLLRLAVSADSTATSRFFLRQGSAERPGLGLSDSIAALQQAGLLRPWPTRGVDALLAPRTAGQRVERAWLVLALCLYLAALLVDSRGIWRALWRAWRPAATRPHRGRNLQ